MRDLRTTAVVALVIAALGAWTAGCGGDDDAPAQSEGRKLTTVTVGVLPVADMAPLYLGIKKGFFREEGLDVKTQVAQGGAAIVPAVMSGDFQFGFGNNVSLMIARARDLPLRIVASGGPGATDPQNSDQNGLLVAGDSDIRSVKDLAGKTFAVTTVENLAEVTIRATLEKAGVDDSRVRFIEVPFPEMNTAVQRGRADVAWSGEPWITLGKQQGMRNIIDPMAATTPRLSIATFFSTDPYLQENPEVADGFRRALERSLDYAGSHEQEARAILPTFTSLKSDVVQKIALPDWSAELNVDSIRLTYRLARKYGVLERDLDLAQLLPQDGA
jgi:NitT/TauT family transport system substrate-binding protein